MPKFSIIIPVYNRPDEVAELLESLTHLSCPDIEILVIEIADTSVLPGYRDLGDRGRLVCAL